MSIHEDILADKLDHFDHYAIYKRLQKLTENAGHTSDGWIGTIQELYVFKKLISLFKIKTVIAHHDKESYNHKKGRR